MINVHKSLQSSIEIPLFVGEEVASRPNFIIFTLIGSKTTRPFFYHWTTTMDRPILSRRTSPAWHASLQSVSASKMTNFMMVEHVTNKITKATAIKNCLNMKDGCLDAGGAGWTNEGFPSPIRSPKNTKHVSSKSMGSENQWQNTGLSGVSVHVYSQKVDESGEWPVYLQEITIDYTDERNPTPKWEDTYTPLKKNGWNRPKKGR